MRTLYKPKMNTASTSTASNTSLQDKIILLGFLALTTVEMAYCHHPTPAKTSRLFAPHELSTDHPDEGLKKLHQYRHRRWGGDAAALSPSHSAKQTRPKDDVPTDSNALQDQLLIMLHQQIRGGAVEDVEGDANILDLHRQLDYSDNKDQVRVLKHHYLNEFGHHISLSEVLKDYSDSCTIHQVVDNRPNTFHGRDGARQAFLQLFNLVPHDLSHHIEFEHIAIDQNHAQVVWRALIPSQQKMIRGMDSFAFDENNRIVHQSIMALSVPIKESEDDNEDSVDEKY